MSKVESLIILVGIIAFIVNFVFKASKQKSETDYEEEERTIIYRNYIDDEAIDYAEDIEDILDPLYSSIRLDQGE